LVFTELIFNFAGFLKGIVKTLEQYSIPFSGLKQGTHTFDFTVGKKFFEQFERTEIKDGNIDVVVVMEKEERLFDLHFTIKGTVMVSCDRCDENIWIPVEGTQRLLVKLGDSYFEESEDVQVIPETDHKLELGTFIYEYIHLMLPARRVHPEDENGESQCDPEIIRRLTELNEHHEPDPRWEILGKLKGNA
jgi:uncharacterized metal-binding protein YceD (DUF177 family)